MIAASNPDLTAQVHADQPAAGRAIELWVKGMTCANCLRHVTEALQGVPGVAGVTVGLETGRAVVRYKANASPNPDALVAAVVGAGYRAGLVRAEAGREAAPARRLAGWRSNLWIGVLGTAPLMAGEWLLGLGSARWFSWVAFGLGSMVQLVAGAPFYRGAWQQLRAGRSNMDTLVALGSTTAFAYSVWALFAGGHLYFTEAAGIITLISLGHWLEARVQVRAASALQGLLRLAPMQARQRDPNGNEQEVPVAALRVDDRVVLRPGDRVPTDGVITEGAAAVDESMLTGESVPVDKSAGHKLYAGTVNLNGRLVMRVTATGEATALAQIIAALERAQSSRAQIQRLADQVSNVFVPAVILVALLAGLWWGLAPETARRVHEGLAPVLWPAHPPTGMAAGFIIAAAVLIIACPCAMGLATPAAIMAAANAAARRGILIRDGVALEKAGRVTAVLLDKTGTLTVGKPEVVAMWVSPSLGGDSFPILTLAAELTRHSDHPLSRAVHAHVRAAETLQPNGAYARPDCAHWQEIRGAGVQAQLLLAGELGPMARLGSLNWLAAVGVELSGAEAFVNRWTPAGATVLGLAADRRLLALFALLDVPKPAAGQVVGYLRARGLDTFLVTGDNPRTAMSLAAQVGIPPSNVFAEARPEQKAELIKHLQARGVRVAFVGDGLNDAPALAQADLGIAVSRASDIAREAADIILLKSEIEAVPEALGLARATLRTIKQNLFWAFFYNALGVPLAALGFMSPILCALAMGVSDLVVIGNALRLSRWGLQRHFRSGAPPG